MIIRGDKVFLRPLRADDADDLLLWENDAEVRAVSETAEPYTRETIERFIGSHHDIYLQKQLRLMICEIGSAVRVGCIDLFDFDNLHHRAGIGILIYQPRFRRKGYASEAIRLVMSFAAENLCLHQVYCNVLDDNRASLSLFEKLGFTRVGTKVDWHASGNGWKNEVLLQRILT